ncbi:hypothetical protein LPJ72_005748 [Coemansia sp. Benny D160-2]|nr:hypothetical protein LPJ72_005748 [Coemansia sp. Benny D160-2]
MSAEEELKQQTQPPEGGQQPAPPLQGRTVAEEADMMECTSHTSDSELENENEDNSMEMEANTINLLRQRMEQSIWEVLGEDYSMEKAAAMAAKAATTFTQELPIHQAKEQEKQGIMALIEENMDNLQKTIKNREDAKLQIKELEAKLQEAKANLPKLQSEVDEQSKKLAAAELQLEKLLHEEGHSLLKKSANLRKTAMPAETQKQPAAWIPVPGRNTWADKFDILAEETNEMETEDWDSRKESPQ